jgi:hypothetical protein
MYIYIYIYTHKLIQIYISYCTLGKKKRRRRKKNVYLPIACLKITELLRSIKHGCWASGR